MNMFKNGLVNEQQMNRQFKWLIEQIKCLKTTACACDFEETSLTYNEETGELKAIFVDGSERVVNISSGTNNIVKTLSISENLLSGVGTLEEQICNYILSLPENERTILNIHSKWNVLITTENSSLRVHNQIYNLTYN